MIDLGGASKIFTEEEMEKMRAEQAARRAKSDEAIKNIRACRPSRTVQTPKTRASSGNGNTSINA
jgi:hypothetical protein